MKSVAIFAWKGQFPNDDEIGADPPSRYSNIQMTLVNSGRTKHANQSRWHCYRPFENWAT